MTRRATSLAGSVAGAVPSSPVRSAMTSIKVSTCCTGRRPSPTARSRTTSPGCCPQALVGLGVRDLAGDPGGGAHRGGGPVPGCSPMRTCLGGWPGSSAPGAAPARALPLAGESHRALAPGCGGRFEPPGLPGGVPAHRTIQRVITRSLVKAKCEATSEPTPPSTSRQGSAGRLGSRHRLRRAGLGR
jgi:hypothetical protein